MTRQLPLVFALASAAAFAAIEVNFNRLNASVSEKSLTVDFTASGLPSKASVNFRATSEATAVYGCYEGSGKLSRALTVREVVAANATLDSDTKGDVEGKVQIPAPDGASVVCPAGQEKVLSSVSFSDIRIVERASTAMATIDGTVMKAVHALRSRPAAKPAVKPVAAPKAKPTVKRRRAPEH